MKLSDLLIATSARCLQASHAPKRSAQIAVRALSEQALFREMVAPDRWQEGYRFARQEFRKKVVQAIEAHHDASICSPEMDDLENKILEIFTEALEGEHEQKA